MTKEKQLFDQGQVLVGCNSTNMILRNEMDKLKDKVSDILYFYNFQQVPWKKQNQQVLNV